MKVYRALENDFPAASVLLNSFCLAIRGASLAKYRLSSVHFKKESQNMILIELFLQLFGVDSTIYGLRGYCRLRIAEKRLEDPLGKSCCTDRRVLRLLHVIVDDDDLKD